MVIIFFCVCACLVQTPFFDQPTAATAKEPEELLADLPADDVSEEQCSICTEAFARFWNADEEIWMIKNAVKVGEKV